MITYYTHEELADFGAYMVSKERTDRIKSIYKEGDSRTLEERLSDVYQLDVDAWLEKRSKETTPQIQG